MNASEGGSVSEIPAMIIIDGLLFKQKAGLIKYVRSEERFSVSILFNLGTNRTVMTIYNTGKDLPLYIFNTRDTSFLQNILLNLGYEFRKRFITEN